ncbi:OLC1v1031701C1 [Oldenlandia corymbosa var. corymbosa]|uniref:OLC1v1031701C1 n=1 Tax=Oldenlandia corymbosa var. corymbosa TaxID=529605 RepID=A0AAV1CJZ9_OLDCO|nr:OLC1v1031701C1 [Oldenlandia corymbosa var. corymbosa]
MAASFNCGTYVTILIIALSTFSSIHVSEAARHLLQTTPALPTLPTTLPNFPAGGGAATMPPALPTLPTTLPTLPNPTSLPPNQVPTIPGIPKVNMPPMPAATSFPNIPNIPTSIPSIPNFPTSFPSIPGIPTLAAPPSN